MGLILPQEVEVRLSNKDLKHYINKGYEIPLREASESYKKKYKKNYCYDLSKSIIVNVEDLLCGSHVLVDATCDYCNKLINVPYKDYLKSVKTGLFCCKDCLRKKGMETCIKKYGVDIPSRLPEVYNKAKQTKKERYGDENYNNKQLREQTNLERYGVKNAMLNKDILNKHNNIMSEKYQDLEYKENVFSKIRDTMLERYGCEHPMYSDYIKNKVVNTVYNRYGVDNVLKSPIVRNKIIQSLYSNQSQATSAQQLYINDLYNGKLNYPCSYYSLDIALLEDMIDCEIDFGGHDLSVKLGDITQEEFNQKEIIRNQIVKRNGYKTMRIISRKDKLPSDSKLLEILDYSRTYFKENPERSWIEFDIDNSTMRNALCKDNAQHYDFGELRTLPRKSA